MSSISSVGSSASELHRLVRQHHAGGLGGALVGGAGASSGLGGSALLAPAGGNAGDGSGGGSMPGIGGVKLGADTLAALLDIQEQATATGGAAGTPTDADAKTRGATFAHRLFAAIDSGGDGQISKGELAAAFASTGRDPASADALFARMDSNGDGSVSRNELDRALRHGHRHGGAMDALTSLGQMQSSDSVTNADGSTTTTISYANGTRVAITVPASAAQNGGTGSAAATTPTNAAG